MIRTTRTEVNPAAPAVTAARPGPWDRRGRRSERLHPSGSRKSERRKRMAKAQVKGIEMAYNIDGEGEPVLLIGGFTMVKESWEL